MGVHAKLSASQTKEWVACPGIIALNETFPLPDVSGEAARLGTCAHALIERCLENGEAPAAYQGRLIEILKVDTPEEGISILRKNAKLPRDPQRVVFEVDDDMVEATTKFVDYVNGRLREFFPPYDDPNDPYAISKEAHAKGVLHLETWTNPLPDRDDTGGTADVTIDAWPDILEVIDYKHGTGVFVPVEKNYQLRSYTLGKAHETAFDYDVFRYAIGQPRHHRAPDSGIMFEEQTEEELRAFQDELTQATAEVDRGREIVAALPAPTLKAAMAALDEAGLLEVKNLGSVTIYHPYLQKAPSAVRLLQDTAKSDFDLDEPGGAPEPDHEHDLMVVKWALLIESVIKGSRDRIDQAVLAGEKVEGFKVVETLGNRTWSPDVDEADLIDQLVMIYELDRADVCTTPALKTAPQILKLVSGDDKETLEEEYIHRPKGLKVVPESNKAPAVDMAARAQSDFDEDL